jgi:hypothetical protein
LQSFNSNIWRSFELVPVRAQIESHFYIKRILNLRAYIWIQLINQYLFLLCFLNSLLHKTECLRYNFFRKIELNLFSVDSLILILHFSWEKVHHIIVLLQFFKNIFLVMLIVSYVV